MKTYVETDRLIMRELDYTDTEGMFELDSDARVHTYVGNKPIKTIEEARQVIGYIRDQYVNLGIGRWAVVEKESGNFIGWSGIKLVTDEYNGRTNFYDIGYRFITRYWGKGYATETAIAAVQYAFGQMNVPRVSGITHMHNIASQQVLQKAGLKFIENFWHEGEEEKWFELDNPNLKK